MFEQAALGITPFAAGVPAEPADGRDHPVAGDDDGDRVGPAGTTDRARRRAEGAGDRAVAAGAATGDSPQGLPDPLLEGRPRECQRQIEDAAGAGEILVQLARGLVEHAACRPPTRRAAVEKRDDRAVPGGDSQRPERALDRVASGGHRVHPPAPPAQASARAVHNRAGSVWGSEQTGPTHT